jgi:hypothetical protein
LSFVLLGLVFLEHGSDVRMFTKSRAWRSGAYKTPSAASNNQRRFPLKGRLLIGCGEYLLKDAATSPHWIAAGDCDFQAKAEGIQPAAVRLPADLAGLHG